MTFARRLLSDFAKGAPFEPRRLGWWAMCFARAVFCIAVLLALLGVAVWFAVRPTTSLGSYEDVLARWSGGESGRAVEHFPRDRAMLPEGSRFYALSFMQGKSIFLYVPGTPEEARALAERYGLERPTLEPYDGYRPVDEYERHLSESGLDRFVHAADQLSVSPDFRSPDAVWGIVTGSERTRGRGLLWMDLATGERVYDGLYD
ncbi:MAG: hypothetical protein Tsb0013_10090 [Phycisphaerales bacterium]